MEAIVYFTRHGSVWDKDALCEEGKKELTIVKEILENFGFKPEICFSSKANRCIETARIFCPKAEIVTLPELSQFGPAPKFKEFAKSIIDTIIASTHKNILVVCHDDAPFIYACYLAELNGANIYWNKMAHAPYTATDRGVGYLVFKSSVIKIMHNSPRL